MQITRTAVQPDGFVYVPVAENNCTSATPLPAGVPGIVTSVAEVPALSAAVTPAPVKFSLDRCVSATVSSWIVCPEAGNEAVISRRRTG
jgi:hypothetical protein